jgi:hypothetical protein
MTNHSANEPRKLLADLISYVVLVLLGHRWPAELAQPAAPPDECSGMVPLTDSPGEKTLQQMVCRKLLAMFGGRATRSSLEQDFAALAGCTVDQWLTRHFFRHHLRQFHRRPVVWQLQCSSWTARRPPVFACVIGYQRLSHKTLVALKQRYLKPRPTQLMDDRGREELAGFASKLEHVLAGGFRTAEHPELSAQDVAYEPDLNDGVRVNIAPWQRAGLLAVPVLAADDVEEAIADRARWRGHAEVDIET